MKWSKIWHLFWPKFDIYSHFYSFIKFLAILWRIWTLQFSSIAKMVQLFSENCHCHIWSKYSQNFWPFMTNIWPRENARSNPIILTCDAVMGYRKIIKIINLIPSKLLCIRVQYQYYFCRLCYKKHWSINKHVSLKIIS